MPIKYTPASSGGNADTATALATARAINGVNFDGSAPVTVTAAAGTLSGNTLKSTVVTSSLTTVGTIGTGTWNGTAIATAYIAADAITGAKIADDAINSEHYTDASVDFAHIQNVAANSILGRNANSSGVLSEVALTTTQILIGDGTGFTAAALSGQATMTNAGVVTVNSSTLNAAVADENVSGITASFTAGEDLVRGEVVYFKAGDSKMWKAVATAAATSRCVAMAAADISADAAGLFLLQGFCQDNGSFPAYTIGGVLFTPEAETSSQNVPEQAAPDSDGDFVQTLGWAYTANTVFFNPSMDVIEHA